MKKLENIKDKKKIVENFFKWLLEKDEISLREEVDISLVSQYEDPNIYYTKEIYDFFNTKAMKRMGKISQLGLMTETTKNCYHNRLEHSKGTYNRKLEELIYLTSDEKYKKYIEENNLKQYLIAELIKEAAHDIGHLPLSHVIEIKVIGRKGFHEDIGKRILLEDKQIDDVLKKIHPELKNCIKKLIDEDYLNMKSHDEGNYDVDRLDYLLRDSLYNENPIQDYHHEQYKRKYAKTDKDGNILKNENGSIVLVEKDEKCELKKAIDIYENSSLKKIENFLELRVQAYKNIYFSKNVQVKDTLVGILINNLLADSSKDVAPELKDFINKLKSQDVNIDLNEYLKWNDVKFYNECLDSVENCNDKYLKNLLEMVIPNLETLMIFTYACLNLKSQKENNLENLDQEDKELVKKIKKIIYSDSEVSKILKNKNFYNENCLICYDGEKSKDIKQKFKDDVNYITATVKGYSKKVPIYIEDKNGEVFPLHAHPERSYDWENRKETIDVAFCIIPKLKSKGINEDEIKKEFLSEKDIVEEKKGKKINMSPIKTESNMKKYFEI